nr:unnamed protein product [Spirometra erinaceieuropaei]
MERLSRRLFPLGELIDGGGEVWRRSIENVSEVIGSVLRNRRFLYQKRCYLGAEKQLDHVAGDAIDVLDGDEDLLHTLEFSRSYNTSRHPASPATISAPSGVRPTVDVGFVQSVLIAK